MNPLIKTDSLRLKNSGQQAINILNLISMSRYGFLIVGMQQFSSGHILEPLVLSGLALLCHKACYPYAGYRVFGFKHLSNGDDFIPLRRWMVPESAKELTGCEYDEVMKSFTEITKRKMFTIAQKQQKLTVFDSINLALFEWQFAQREECRLKDEALKDEIKKHFKSE